MYSSDYIQSMDGESTPHTRQQWQTLSSMFPSGEQLLHHNINSTSSFLTAPSNNDSFSAGDTEILEQGIKEDSFATTTVNDRSFSALVGRWSTKKKLLLWTREHNVACFPPIQVSLSNQITISIDMSQFRHSNVTKITLFPAKII